MIFLLRFLRVATIGQQAVARICQIVILLACLIECLQESRRQKS
jgi:hypothetical protein